VDADRFDALSRSLAAVGSRRRALATALGSAVGLLSLAAPDAARAAKSPKCKRKPNECERCDRGKCERKDGEKRCKAGKIKPKASGTPCSIGSCQNGFCVASVPPCVAESAAATCAGRCGSRTNNCGQKVSCAVCSPGKICLSNGTCADP
jgi:hypothetical protein